MYEQLKKVSEENKISMGALINQNLQCMEFGKQYQLMNEFRFANQEKKETIVNELKKHGVKVQLFGETTNTEPVIQTWKFYKNGEQIKFLKLFLVK